MLKAILSRTGWLLGGLGITSLILLVVLGPTGPASTTGLLLATVLVGLLALSPIPFGSGEALLVHAVTLPTALAFGPVEAAVALALGLSLGQAAAAGFQSGRGPTPSARLTTWSFALGQQGTSLTIAVFVYLALGGTIPLGAAPDWLSPPYLGLTFAFLISFLGLQAIKHAGRGERLQDRTQLLALAVFVAFLPLPYAVLTAVVVQVLGEMALLVLGGGPAVVSPIVRGLMVAERDLQRRLQELSTLGEVSEAMRSSLNLEAILNTIYLQVAHLLGVQNFYIALHNPLEGALSYPLAIKGGQREEWPDRSVSDRLTDRVILQGEPILISENAPQALLEMGMPELADAPEAWLGVPLQNPDRVIGCLGVFHTSPGRKFTEEDQALLITLAGQASVAIENALLYRETRRRAQALASLNEITSQMSSSLDPEQTLALVSRSLTRVVGGNRAAIYLLSEDGSELSLAQSEGLSEALRQRLGALPLDQSGLTQAYRTQSPVIREKLTEADGIPADLAQKLVSEGILGAIDMPLVTPSGPIGMATVFFGESPQLEPEQLEMLEIFVAQSAIAVANARAHVATDQALNRQLQQLSRLEAIGRDLVSTLNPDELFESLLESALNATECHTGHLAVAAEDDSGLRLVTQRGYPEDADLPTEQPGAPEAFGLAGRAFRELETINVSDVRKEHSHLSWSSDRTRSLLAVPIRRWGRPIGVLTVESPDTDAFGDEQVRFLSQLAAYAAVAITNARLYRQLENHLREQSLLYQASAQIATSMDMDTIALAVADSLSAALETSRVTVYRLADQRDGLEPLATAHEGRISRPQPSIQDEHNVHLLEAIRAGTLTRFDADGAHAVAVPLQVGTDPVGVLEISHGSRSHFSEAEIRTAQTVASQAAIALQNSQLFRRVRESRDRLMAVLNSSREGILMVDREGQVLLANKQLERFLGLDAEEVRGETLNEESKWLWQALGFTQQEIQKGFAGVSEPPDHVEEGEILHVDEPNERILRRVIHPVTDAEGGRMGWLIVLHDVTEEREIEETREQLTQMIVHDLRSPLTTIRGSLHLLERSLPEEERPGMVEQAVKVSNRSVTQLLGLVDSLLDLARLEGDPLQLERADIDIEDMLHELAEAFVPEANDEGIIVNVEVDSELQLVQADGEKLRRVLHNLLDNALKFTPEGGQTEVRAERAEQGIVLSVNDSGPGIPKEMREKIFDRFAQVPGHAGRRRGTGLGLAFAKLAVEAHGGRIWVEDSDYAGSSFRIWLPAGPQDAK